MALIGMAVYCTDQNKRDYYLEKTLNSLKETVDFSTHELGVSINSFTLETEKTIHKYGDIIKHISWNGSNLGTANAVNKIWKLRKPNQHLIKMDEDIINYNYGWIDELEQAIAREPKIGIIGLKRKDLLQSPNRGDYYKTTLYFLPHKLGQTWIPFEESHDVMGSCTMFNSLLVDKIGGLMQPDTYGFDDNLASIRCKLAGFKMGFLPHIEIDHIDEGGDSYCDWKRKEAGEKMQAFNQMKADLISGKLNIKVEL